MRQAPLAWQAVAVPELPEVAALARTLSNRTEGLLVARVDLAAINALKTFDPPVGALGGTTVLGWGRHGKFLDLEVVDGDGQPLHLIVHLARAGWIRWRDEVPVAAPGLGRRGGGGSPLAFRVAFVTDQGEPAGGIDVTEAGTQKRLACYVVRDPQDVPGVMSLGPDPMSDEFTPELLHAILAAGGRNQLKGLLRDQSRIAGIGNAYSDEILNVARLSPFAPAGGLGEDGEQRLYQAVVTTLADAVRVALEVDPTGLKAEKKARMRVHGRAGQKCPQCGDVVREVSFADSSLQYCPTCQTGGRLLADRRMSKLLK